MRQVCENSRQALLLVSWQRAKPARLGKRRDDDKLSVDIVGVTIITRIKRHDLKTYSELAEGLTYRNLRFVRNHLDPNNGQQLKCSDEVSDVHWHLLDLGVVKPPSRRLQSFWRGRGQERGTNRQTQRIETCCRDSFHNMYTYTHTHIYIYIYI